MSAESGRPQRRIAINVGSGFVPGMNAVVKGAALAASELGWDLVGIRDGFEGLLHRDRYSDGGLVPLGREQVADLDPAGSIVLGQSPRVDPFHVRQTDDDDLIEEVDLSDQLLDSLKSEGVDSLISVVGDRGLSILYKLHRKGLRTVCIPRALDNAIAGTMVSFGFNSALSFTIEMLDRARQAAQSARKVAVVEVLGRQAGWLALQAGIAVSADAVLIPEIPADLDYVAAKLKDRLTPTRPWGLVVVAAGARFASTPEGRKAPQSSFKASLSPLATEDASEHAIKGSGRAAKVVASRLQLLLAQETQPLVLGKWVRGGAPTAVDRQLGLSYGAAAVRALNDGNDGVMVAFHPPNIECVPLAQAINHVRTVPMDGDIIQSARSLGICLGEEQ